ncbi:HNH endonuclease [Paenibacillus peoriae]|uniref:HNH endonuclease n=1 Tax=Paenibacillus peoriae TaxID=59893 RepID=A0A7H0Y5A9_9BACL|nr:HNH endonuclease [Paenibacillus peoriae]QNR66267.1 HNH endonuclease [Paenibacillus peoriae]
MLDFQEKFLLKSMLQKNGKSSLQIVAEEYKRAVSLSFNDVLNDNNNFPRWMNSIRKAHQSLKDKNLISGFELGEWALTKNGLEVAKSLDKTEINNLVLYGNEEAINEILDKKAITFENLRPFNNSITELIRYPMQGILVIGNKKRLSLKITKLTLFNSYVHLEFSGQELIEGNFENTVLVDNSLEIFLGSIIHILPSTFSDEDIETPSTVISTIVRKIRDTAMSQKLKKMYNHHCQICGETIITGVNRYYSEAHHLKPIGKPHHGPDIESNLIVLCPNHHAEFDAKSISINPETLLIEHINIRNRYINNPLKLSLHTIDLKFITYHYELFKMSIYYK